MVYKDDPKLLAHHTARGKERGFGKLRAIGNDRPIQRSLGPHPRVCSRGWGESLVLANTNVAVHQPVERNMPSASGSCSCEELRRALRDTRAELARTRDHLIEARQQVRELEHDRTSLEQALTRVLELDRVLQNGQTPFRAFRDWETPREERLFSRAGGMNTPWLERSAIWFSPREPGSAHRALIIQEALERRFLEDKTPGEEWGCSPVLLQTSDLTMDQGSLPLTSASITTDQDLDESPSTSTTCHQVLVE